MDAVLSAYEERLREIVRDFEAVIDGLPADALNWSPGPELNSIGVLVTHSAGATRFWIGDVIAQEPSARVREREFQTADVDAVLLRQHLAELLAYVHKVLLGLGTADLEKERFAPSRNQHLTIAYCLMHALAHCAEHVGHAQMTRQLWEQQSR